MSESKFWPPCYRMSRNNTFPPIEIKQATGGWLITKDGRRVFDGTSSWWCKHLGHRNPVIIDALQQQMNNYIHAIGANTYSNTIHELCEKLGNIFPDLTKVSFASDGSCAVEIAIKLSLHTRKILQPKDNRNKIIKLSGAYHGETILALSVSDCAMYKSPYKEILINTHTAQVHASCKNSNDPIWHNSNEYWSKTKDFLEKIKDESAILIVEPILQAANCMNLYSADFLNKLIKWAKENDIDVIADEIMTGFWRTGKLMAIQYTENQPDFVCLGKGLTAGTIPMSAVLCSKERFDSCYPKDTSQEKAFLHSHTYSAHALGAAAANAAMNVYFDPKTHKMVDLLSKNLAANFNKILGLKNQRNIGCVVAGELNINKNVSPAELQKIAAEFGLLIRPLGNTVYLTPPINSTAHEVKFMCQALEQTLDYFSQ